MTTEPKERRRWLEPDAESPVNDMAVEDMFELLTAPQKDQLITAAGRDWVESLDDEDIECLYCQHAMPPGRNCDAHWQGFLAERFAEPEWRAAAELGLQRQEMNAQEEG